MSAPRPAFDVNEVGLGPGQLLLEASAGTGKTWSLTTLAARALVEGRIEKIDQLLMVTFTNAATDDLRTRLRARLQETLRAGLRPRGDETDVYLRAVPERATAESIFRLRAALRDFDRARVHTLHSYCARLLQESAFETGSTLELGEPTDAAPMRRTALEDAWREIVVEGPAWLVAVAAFERLAPSRYEDLIGTEARHRRIELRPPTTSLQAIGAHVVSALETIEREVAPSELIALLEPALATASPMFTKKGLTEHGAALAHSVRLLASASDQTRMPGWIGLARHLAGSLRVAWRRKHLDGVGWFVALEELREVLDPVDAALRAEVLERARARLRANKLREELLDYDDLVERVRSALADPDRKDRLVALARANTVMACIDEFQDTDVDQWAIFRTLFGDAVTLVLVGDPKQAIYGFRGADVFAYLDAREVVREGRGQEYGLACNFRSHPELVEAVNVIFGRGDSPFAAEGIDHAGVDAHHESPARALIGDENPAFQLLAVELEEGGKAAYERAVIVRTVAEIERLLSSGIEIDDDGTVRPLHAGDLTVLTRKHHQSAKVHRALRDAGIASVLGRSGDVHRSEAMEELGLLLDAILDPRDTRKLRRALATRLWGSSLSALQELESDESVLASILESLDDLRRTWHRYGVLVMIDHFLQRYEVPARLLAEPDGDRLITDLRHSLELVHRAAAEDDLSPGGTVAWLWRELPRTHHQDERRQLRLDRDDAAVRILTAHGSKGLQYEVVFVPFAWAGTRLESPFHWHEDVQGERTLVLDYRSAAEIRSGHAQAEREDLAEELRLLYVALTRAKRRCVVFTTSYHSNASNTAGRSALHYLLYRAGAHAGEAHDSYVSRCIAELANGPEQWGPLLPAWIEEHACIGVPEPVERTGTPPSPMPMEVALRARELPAQLGSRLVPWSLVSFTSLVRGVLGAHDARSEAAEAAEMEVAERSDPPAAATLLREELPAGIFAFARGARAGVCLHEILERSDFTQPPDASLEAAARKRLSSILEHHGFADPQAHAARIDPLAVADELVHTARAERFPLGEFVLSAIDREHRLDEWEFRAALGRVRVHALASAFERHAGEPWNRRLGARLRRSSDRAIEGLLGGFVDLVFEHGGRWFLVDWKSNHLGDRVDDYDPSAIEAAMLEHDYVLQLSLYSVAVHRYLQLRLPGYDYEVHFGGAAYAFLRGWCGRTDRGWFAWKPPRALIEALDASLSTGGPS